MNVSLSTPGTGGHPLVVTRLSDTQWHAVQDDHVVGHGDAAHRPDGRLFVSIDAWHDAVFDRIAATMTADLPAPLHAVTDEADHETTAAWQRAGFTPVRRERGHLVPTDPQATGLDAARPPAGVTIVPAGEAQEGPLRDLDRVIHAEVEAGVGWPAMPAQIPPRPAGTTVLDPSQYAVARQDGRYVGLLRIAPLPRQPRIGMLAVRADHQRRGIARALLAHALGELHRNGTATAWAEVAESNTAATALFEAIGARRAGATLELVHP
ncbi:acetyltransferase (GNAT) family protein [Streptomyces sp. 1114.5]|uniref:GNAT family N-acetyltransferase n=1 Tax=unclassified Streptomyces TaxID=2593676 RepID=UPI000BCC86DF|nr:MULTISPECIES: GNAT family N-acetyltransferase [unclassified Streptomyces]RKT20220.1 acetyltransferase (GNAT) family protein [Streptomyces sp. 1114.5]SOB78652.1 Acetyltransferase (GNAT) family protein [Streptomyces sp. 1331.2]